MRGQFTVSQLADKAGIAVGTVCHDERIGLLTLAARSNGDQRLFDEPARGRLCFVHHTRDLGFSLGMGPALFKPAEQPCEQADVIAMRHLADVAQRIAGSEALRCELARMVEGCATAAGAECPVMETLAHHANSRDDHGSAGDAVIRTAL